MESRRGRTAAFPRRFGGIGSKARLDRKAQGFVARQQKKEIRPTILFFDTMPERNN